MRQPQTGIDSVTCALRSVGNSIRLTFTDDDAEGHRVPGCHAGHDRTVSDAKFLDSVDLVW
jgi:hypothetical protein